MKAIFLPLAAVLALGACGMVGDSGTRFTGSGEGAIQIDTSPPTAAELNEIVVAIEELGKNRITLIEDDGTRAVWRLTCVALARRIRIENMPDTAAEFCGPVIEALD